MKFKMKTDLDQIHLFRISQGFLFTFRFNSLYSKGKYKEVSRLGQRSWKSKPLKTKRHYRIISEKIRELLKEQGKKQIISYYWNPCKHFDWICKRNFFPFLENLRGLQPFFQVAVAEIDHDCAMILWSLIQRLNDCINSSDEGNQENLLFLW